MKTGRGNSDVPTASRFSLTQRVASGAFWISVEMGATQLMSLLVFSIMARFVTPSDFGLISITYLVIYTLKSLIIDNVVVAISRKANPSDDDYSTSFWLTLGLSIAAAICTYLSAGITERLMNSPGLGEVMRSMSVILLFMGLARTHEMRLLRTFQFRTLATRAVVGTLLGGGLGIALASKGYGLDALVAQQVTTSAISLTLLWLTSKWRPSTGVSVNAARQIFGYLKTITPTTITNVVSQNSDTFLVAYFFGPSSAGLYTIAKRLRLALQLMAATPINGVVFSALAEVQDDKKQLENVSQRLLGLISLICAPVFFGSCSIARDAIIICFGEGWIGAAPIFSILTLGAYFVSIQNFVDMVFILKNRQLWSFYNLIIQLAISTLAFYPLSKFGQAYLAIPFVFPYIITFPLIVFLTSKLVHLTLRQWLAALGPSLISSIIMFSFVWLLTLKLSFASASTRVIMSVIVGGTVYLVTMLVIDRRAVLNIFQYASKRLHQIVIGN